jgi:hypothetical protein
MKKKIVFFLSRLFGMDEDKKPSHTTVPLITCELLMSEHCERAGEPSDEQETERVSQVLKEIFNMFIFVIFSGWQIVLMYKLDYEYFFKNLIICNVLYIYL